MRFLPITSAALFFVLVPLPGMGQLVIEGGPFGASLSNRDGKIMGPAASGNPGVVTGVPGRRMTFGPDSRGLYRAFSSQDASWFPAPVVARPDGDSLGTPYFREIDIRRIQQIQKWQRELGVIRTSRQDEMVFAAARLFGSGRSSLSQNGRSLLDRVISYAGTGPYSSLSVAYQFEARESPERGASRSEAIIDYLKAKSGNSVGWFHLEQPQRLDPESPIIRDGSLVFVRLLRPEASPASLRD